MAALIRRALARGGRHAPLFNPAVGLGRLATASFSPNARGNYALSAQCLRGGRGRGRGEVGLMALEEFHFATVMGSVQGLKRD